MTGLRLLTVREAAKELRVCTAIVYRLCNLGKLRHSRILHSIRIAPSDLASFIRRVQTD